MSNSAAINSNFKQVRWAKTELESLLNSPLLSNLSSLKSSQRENGVPSIKKEGWQDLDFSDTF